MAWCFEGEADPVADAVLDRLATDDSVVPALWKLEVANVLLAAERGGRFTQAQIARFVGLIDLLPISIDSGEHDLLHVIGVGRAHGLSSYDTCYLELAQRLGVSLATLDRTLVEAARSAGVEVFHG